jgi:uncharacterized membrane protein YeaQ/YmgE (transglycosylase-associated protein family)
VPHMDILGWIVVGFLAGCALQRGGRRGGGPQGCLGNTIVGILGGLFGGWFATEELHMGSTTASSALSWLPSSEPSRSASSSTRSKATGSEAGIAGSEVRAAAGARSGPPTPSGGTIST